MQLQPRAGPESRRDHRESGNARCPPATLAGPDRERCGDDTEPTYNAHAVLWWEGIQHRNDEKRARRGADQVGAVDRGDPVLVDNEGQSDRCPNREEWQRQEPIDLREMELLTGIPDDLQRIERDPLRQREPAHRETREQHRAPGKGFCEAGRKDPSREGEEGAAGADPKQRHADDHIGEVVPEQDREEPGQQDLVGDRSAREDADRGKKSHALAAAAR